MWFDWFASLEADLIVHCHKLWPAYNFLKHFFVTLEGENKFLIIFDIALCKKM